jgi:hypothetical protein
MVLSATPAIVILPIMCWLRRDAWNQRLIVLLASLVIAIDIYFITNPYVLIHLLGDRTILLSNLRNSQAMYTAPASIGGFINALKLLAIGSGVFMFGVLGVREVIRRTELKLLGAVSAIIVIQFFLLATSKPAEYARFAILPDIALLIVGFVALASVKPRVQYSLAGIALLVTAILGGSYLWHFIDDARERSSRVVAAERLREINPSSISIVAEPAPYSLPPVDLFDTRLILNGGQADVSIRTADHVGRAPDAEYLSRPRLLATPISWARKPFEVRTVPSAR